MKVIFSKKYGKNYKKSYEHLFNELEITSYGVVGMC